MLEHGEQQPVRLGLHRSDYMLHRPAAAPGEDAAPVGILQVELNTIASSFGCLSTKVGVCSS